VSSGSRVVVQFARCRPARAAVVRLGSGRQRVEAGLEIVDRLIVEPEQERVVTEHVRSALTDVQGHASAETNIQRAEQTL
jgi:hypothetical protein